MDNEPVQNLNAPLAQTPSPAPLPRRTPIWLIILLILAVIALTAEGYYYFVLKGQEKTIPSLKKEVGPVVYNDFFNWPGWQGNFVEVNNAGKNLKLTTNSSAWLLYYNDVESAKLVVNGDFELDFKYTFGNLVSPQKGPQAGRIRFYPGPMSGQFLGLTLFQDGSCELSLSQGGKTLVSGVFKSGGTAIKVIFEGVGSGQPENVTLIEEGTGKSTKASFPQTFFSPGSKLSIGIEVGGGVEYFMVYDWLIKADKATNIQKI